MHALRVGGVNIGIGAIDAGEEIVALHLQAVQILPCAQPLQDDLGIARKEQRAVRDSQPCRCVYLTYKIVAKFTSAGLIGKT